MQLLLVIWFVLCYILIIGEHRFRINKAAAALLAGAGCWLILAVQGKSEASFWMKTTEEIAGIAFFLLGAMSIVEIIDSHDGFAFLSARIPQKSYPVLVWSIALLSFFLSALLDNLTTTIVMITLLRKIITRAELRLPIVALIVVAANAGGVWSPMGDVTTTMLWLNGKVESMALIQHLFLPALLSVAVPSAYIAHFLAVNKKEYDAYRQSTTIQAEAAMPASAYWIGAVGFVLLLAVPITKSFLHLPVYVLMLFAMAILWAFTELIRIFKKEEAHEIHTVSTILQRIDTPSILFFVGLLLAISALEFGGYLHQLMDFLLAQTQNMRILTVAIGALSAVVDNVPLVAASMKMLPAIDFPSNSEVWYWLAFCAGTGGSLLVIGSAAGVAAMGMEKLDFMRYIRLISLPAILGLLLALAWLSLV